MSLSAKTDGFYFRARSPDGGIFSGEIESDTDERAIAALRSKGFQTLRLQRTPIRDSWWQQEIAIGGGKRLSVSECEAICRELALLLRSGLVASDALGIVLGSLKRASRPYRFATSVRNGIRLGRSLADAVSMSGFTCPPDFVPVVRAGEESGSLAEALSMLAQSFGDANRFRRAYVSALAYPILLLVVSVAVFGLIAFFVAPSLSNLFASMQRPAPLSIMVLSGASQWLTTHVVLVIGFAILVTMLGIGLGASLRSALRRLCFQLPVVGSALRWSATQRFAATLRLYLISNVPLSAALPNAVSSSGFPGAVPMGRRLAGRIREGKRLAQSLRAERVLPDKVVHMIAVGESGAHLPEVLEAVVAEAKARFEQRMSFLTTLLAPILILVVGAVIGTVIFSIFSALLDINEVVT